MRRVLGVFLLSTAACAPAPDDAVVPGALENAAEVPYAPETTPASLGIAGYAKVLCSAVFVSGRDVERARHESGYFLVPDKDRKHVTDIHVDRDRKRVSVTLRGELTREARFCGDQGCVIIPEGEVGVHFEPESVVTSLGDAATMSSPMGDLLPGKLPEGVDAAKLRAALDAAFRNPASLAAAVEPL